MLSVAYPEPPIAPTAPPEPCATPLRRIAVTFAAEGQTGPRRSKRTPAVSLPRYSRIIFRGGAALAR